MTRGLVGVMMMIKKWSVNDDIWGDVVSYIGYLMLFLFTHKNYNALLNIHTYLHYHNIWLFSLAVWIMVWLTLCVHYGLFYWDKKFMVRLLYLLTRSLFYCFPVVVSKFYFIPYSHFHIGKYRGMHITFFINLFPSFVLYVCVHL